MSKLSDYSPQPLIDHLALCLADWKNQESDRPNRIDDNQAVEIGEILQTQSTAIDWVVSKLDLVDLANNGHFFDFLAGAAYEIGYGQSKTAILGNLWAEVYLRSGRKTQSDLLDGVLKGDDFFTLLSCLPSFVARAAIPTNLLPDWLVILPRITKFQNAEVFCKAVLAGTLLRCDHH